MVFAGIVVAQLALVIVRNLPPVKLCAEFFRLEQERGISWLRFRSFVDEVNRGDEHAAPAYSCAKLRPEVALQVVEDSDQVVSIRVDDETPALKVCDMRVNCHAAHPRSSLCDLNTDARRVHGCNVPAALCQKNRMTPCAARYVEGTPRRESFYNAREQTAWLDGRVLAASVAFVPVRHDAPRL